MAPRLIMVKADGCVAIHADGGAYKPLNWMNAPNTLVEEPRARWVVTNPKGETLIITIEEVLQRHRPTSSASTPACRRTASRPTSRCCWRPTPTRSPRACAWCAASTPPTSVRSTCCAGDADGGAVAVEIKRRGEIDGVEQLARYLERLDRDPMLRPVRGMFVAQQIKPQARVLAESRDLAWVEVDYDELRGIESDELRLF